MPCYHPLRGTRTERGTLKVVPRSIFDEKVEHSNNITVGCGACAGCNESHARSFAIRAMHEKQMHKRTCFLTLTYKDDELPAGRSVDVVDLQKFVKRARQRICLPLRYYAIGEYGSKDARPHYHLILYGFSFHKDRYFWRTSEKGHRLYRSPFLEEIWTKGHSEIGAVSFGSAAYVARYVHEKRRKKDESHYKGRDEEFTTMSRRPGLGRSWIEKFYADVWPRDEVVVDGKRFNPPKYYDQILAERDPELYDLVKIARATRGKKLEADNTLARLAVKEYVKLRQLEGQTRS